MRWGIPDASVKCTTNHNHYKSCGCNLTDDLHSSLILPLSSTRCSLFPLCARTETVPSRVAVMGFLWRVYGLLLALLWLSSRNARWVNLAVLFFSFGFPGADISDFIHNLESQDIKVEMMKHSDYMGAAPHSAAINVSGSSKVTLILHTLNLITESRY